MASERIKVFVTGGTNGGGQETTVAYGS